MQDKKNAGQGGYRTDQMLDIMDAGQDWCRKGQMLDRTDAGQVGSRTGKIQDGNINYRTDAGPFRCRIWWMQDMRCRSYSFFRSSLHGWHWIRKLNPWPPALTGNYLPVWNSLHIQQLNPHGVCVVNDYADTMSAWSRTHVFGGCLCENEIFC